MSKPQVPLDKDGRMLCWQCHGPTRKKWSWPRYESYEEGGVEYQRFISRSTRYICNDPACEYSFLVYSKIDGAKKIDNEHVCNVIR